MQASIILSSLVNIHSNTRIGSSLLKIGEIMSTIKLIESHIKIEKP